MLSDRSEAYSVVIYEDDDMRVEVDTKGRVGAESLIATLAATGSDVEMQEHEIIDEFGLHNGDPDNCPGNWIEGPMGTEPLRVEILRAVKTAQANGNKLVLIGRYNWGDEAEVGKRHKWEVIHKVIDYGLAEFTRFKYGGSGSKLPTELTLTNKGTQLR